MQYWVAAYVPEVRRNNILLYMHIFTAVVSWSTCFLFFFCVFLINIKACFTNSDMESYSLFQHKFLLSIFRASDIPPRDET